MYCIAKLPHIIVLQVAALLLKEYRSQFKGAPLTSTYRFLGQV